MKTNCLETALERVGRILSHKYNIQVRCKGDQCKTDGRTIWLPALPENISDSLWGLVRGELDHETAHILFSDFDGRMKSFREDWGDFGFDLLNVLEDIRVNFAMQREYPGSKENILYSIDEITKTHAIDRMPLPVRFLCGLFMRGMGLSHDQYGNDAKELVERFDPELNELNVLQSTDQVCELAESILKKLNYSPPPKGGQEEQNSCNPSPQNPGSEEEQDSQASPGHESADAGDQASDDSEQGGNSGEEQNSSTQEGNAQSQQTALSKQLQEHEGSLGHPMDMQGQINRLINKELDEKARDVYCVYDPSRDRSIVPRASDKGEAFTRLSGEVRPYVGALRQQLIRTMRAKHERFWVGDQEDGQINSRKLYALLNHNSPKVFRKVTQCESDSVAMTLLIDLSGSMDGPRIHMARQVAILFAETLHQLRIPFEVLGFTTEKTNRALARVIKETGMDLQELSKSYARFYPCIFSVFKAFHEPYKLIKPRIPSMAAKEYTPMDDAILFAAKRIAGRRETRKLILALTDGEPYSGNGTMHHVVLARLQEILDKCKRSGIECSAIGIQSDCVKEHFEDHIVVNNLAELPKAFYKKFSALLRQSK